MSAVVAAKIRAKSSRLLISGVLSEAIKGGTIESMFLFCFANTLGDVGKTHNTTLVAPGAQPETILALPGQLDGQEKLQLISNLPPGECSRELKG